MPLRISPKSQQVVSNLMKQYTDDNPTTYFTDLAAYIPKENFEVQEKLLLPNVLIWDPFTKIPSMSKELMCPLCMQDGAPNSLVRLSGPAGWDAITKANPPRTIWDRGWYCALVGRSYTCLLRNHRVVSYHFGFLQQIPANYIPFVLTHISGITCAAFDDIVRYVEIGLNFPQIENVLYGTMLETYERRKQLYMPGEVSALIDESSETNVAAPGLSTKPNKIIPMMSSTLIRKFFLAQFEKNKKIYQSQFDLIFSKQLHFLTNTSSPSNGFEVNVGYMKNGKWLRVFEKLFLIFNEHGFVNAYGFGTSTDQAGDLLISLAPKNQDVELILFDSNCCNSRDELIEAFPKAIVKYNLKLAEHDLRQYIPVNDEHVEMRKDVEFIFKKTDDSNKENMRRYPSAEPLTILNNIDVFVDKWVDKLNPSLQYEIEKLKLHAQCECLSDIPPFDPYDSSKEKAFEKLRSVFEGKKEKRVTVETACSMVTHLLYVHNCQRGGQIPHKPVWSHRGLDVLGNCEIMEYVMSRKIDPNEERVEGEPSNVETTDGDFVQETNDEQPSIDFHLDLGPISARSETTLGFARLFKEINERFQDLPKTRQHSFLPFTSITAEVWDLGHYLDVCRTVSSILTVEQVALQRTISLAILNDEMQEHNGLFYSVWKSLEDMLKHNKESSQILMPVLEAKGLSEEGGKTTDVVVENLRGLTLSEIAGAHKQLYLSLLDDNADKLVSHDSNQSCVISIDMIKLYLHAVSNVLGLAIVLVPSCRVLPMLPIFPNYELSSQRPLFIHIEKSNDNGALYFKALLDTKGKPILFKKQTNPSHQIRCCCGSRGKRKKSTLKCMVVNCNCYSMRQKCTELCVCVDCGNGSPNVAKKEENQTRPSQQNKRKVRRRSYKPTQTLKTALESPLVDEEDSTPQEQIPPKNTPIKPPTVKVVDSQISESFARNVVFESIIFVVIVEMKTRQKDCVDDELASNLATHYKEFYGELKNSNRLTNDTFLSCLKELDDDTSAAENVFTDWVNNRSKVSQVVHKMRDEFNVDSSNENSRKDVKEHVS